MKEFTSISESKVGEIITVTAALDRYLYEDDSSYFIVANFITKSYDRFVATGNVGYKLYRNRDYEITGRIIEKENTRTGLIEKQVEIMKVKSLAPDTEWGVIQLIQSITGNYSVAERIYANYGMKSLDVIMYEPDKIIALTNIQERTAMRLQEGVKEFYESSNEAFEFLQQYNLNAKKIDKLINVFGDTIIRVVKENPYILMLKEEPYPGESFSFCDKIARDLDFPYDSPVRLKAGVTATLLRSGNQGDVFISISDLLNRSLRLLNQSTNVISGDLLKNTLTDMEREKSLILEEGNAYLYSYYQAEYDLAEYIKRVQSRTGFKWLTPEQIEQLLDRYLEVNEITLEDKQREAVLTFTKKPNGVGIINGGAGTGKSFTLNIIVDLMELIHRAVYGPEFPLETKLMAPTGKASKVMTEATGREAETIHRGLGWTPDGFQYNEALTLNERLIIIDETSMLDTMLARSLMAAIHPDSKVIFLGDPNQLPSIGPGKVLYDMERAQVIDKVTLDIVKRQKEGSIVGENGRNIIKGERPKNDHNPHPKALLRGSKTDEGLLKQVLGALDYLLSLNISPEDIQILSAGRKGPAGVNRMNYILQDKLNPNGEDTGISNLSSYQSDTSPKVNFRIGDRVIHNENTNDLTWVIKENNREYIPTEVNLNDTSLITNGEIGHIVDVITEQVQTNSGRTQNKKFLIVQYEMGLLKYSTDDRGMIDHAYALTIHKSQGSQWYSVITVLAQSHIFMMDNSLLYTAYTRAEDTQLLIATPDSLNRALVTFNTPKRNSTLEKRLNS